MRISDCSSDVCSSDLARLQGPARRPGLCGAEQGRPGFGPRAAGFPAWPRPRSVGADHRGVAPVPRRGRHRRSEEHTSELQSLMRISYAVFCLKKKKKKTHKHTTNIANTNTYKS